MEAAMSAIGLSRHKVNFISSQVDYRREHFMFARTQSCALRELQWEKRLKPLRSWDSFLYPAIGIAGLALLALDLLR